MSWTCFMIDVVEEVVEYATWCREDHRCSIALVPGTLEDSPEDPPGGWPKKCCQCGVRLEPKLEECRSRTGRRRWRRRDTGELRLHPCHFGPGAMFDADWIPWKGEDELALSVVLPPGGESDVWHIDRRKDGTRIWTREGVPPIVTATPSILTSSYHGYLRDGVLTDSI